MQGDKGDTGAPVSHPHMIQLHRLSLVKKPKSLEACVASTLTLTHRERRETLVSQARQEARAPRDPQESQGSLEPRDPPDPMVQMALMATQESLGLMEQRYVRDRSHPV